MPVFDNKKVIVVYILGGPGAGECSSHHSYTLLLTFLVKVKVHNVRRLSRISISLIYQVLFALSRYISLNCSLSLAGDLLRAEQNREGSQYGDLIKTCIREGTIVPMEVTMKLLENAMQAILKERTTGDGWQDGCGRFLIDGFPRKMDQAIGFDEQVRITDVCI
jgi:UMP-CMP kinase